MMKAVWYMPATQPAVTAELSVKTKKLGANAEIIEQLNDMIGATLKTNLRP